MPDLFTGYTKSNLIHSVMIFLFIPGYTRYMVLTKTQSEYFFQPSYRSELLCQTYQIIFPTIKQLFLSFL